MQEKTLAERVQGARLRLKLTGKQLTDLLRANGVEVSHSWLRNIEGGAHNPTPAIRLLQLSKALGVSLEWLLLGDGKRRKR